MKQEKTLRECGLFLIKNEMEEFISVESLREWCKQRPYCKVRNKIIDELKWRPMK